MEDILVVNVLEDGHLRKRAALVSLEADSTRRAYTYSFIERLFHVGVVRSLLVAFAQDLVDVCGQQFWRLGSRGGDSVVVAVLLACLQTDRCVSITAPPSLGMEERVPDQVPRQSPSRP